jgi:hypothetical protein
VTGSCAERRRTLFIGGHGALSSDLDTREFQENLMHMSRRVFLTGSLTSAAVGMIGSEAVAAKPTITVYKSPT